MKARGGLWEGEREGMVEAPASSLFPSTHARSLFFLFFYTSFGKPVGTSAEERAPSLLKSDLLLSYGPNYSYQHTNVPYGRFSGQACRRLKL